jgi:hypothetical protein
LKTLTRDQDALIESQTRLVNQLTACLKRLVGNTLKNKVSMQQTEGINHHSKHVTKRKACKSGNVWQFHGMWSQVAEEAACRRGEFLDGAS